MVSSVLPSAKFAARRLAGQRRHDKHKTLRCFLKRQRGIEVMPFPTHKERTRFKFA